jgi:hypothetical protein
MKTCQACLDHAAKKREEKKNQKGRDRDKENVPVTHGDTFGENMARRHRDDTSEKWPTLPWVIFCSLLDGSQDTAFELSAFVQAPDRCLLGAPAVTGKEYSQTISQMVREKTGYRFK